jgi:hypothetical protein
MYDVLPGVPPSTLGSITGILFFNHELHAVQAGLHSSVWPQTHLTQHQAVRFCLLRLHYALIILRTPNVPFE